MTVRAGMFTKCPLCSPRIEKKACRACVCVCVYLCGCVWEPHLSGEPEGSNDTPVMSMFMSICVFGVGREVKALASVDHINLLCPNCFPLLTWLVTMQFSLSLSHTLTLTPTHFLPRSAITPASSSMISLLLFVMPNNNLPKT